MISPSNSRRCARCGREKPAMEYRPNAKMRSGLNSWCIDCQREYDQERSQMNSAPISPHRHKITKAFKTGDPITYSRAVCEHVAWYVQRKITEFETTHEKEAPPHMAAILSIANSITAQHPPKIRKKLHGIRVDTYKLHCRRCGKPYNSRSPAGLYCNACQSEARRERKQAWYLSPAGQAYRALENTRRNERQRIKRQSRPPKPPVIIQCRRCGAPVEAKTKARKYCDGCIYLVRVEYTQSPEGRTAQRRANRAYRQRQREKRTQTA